MPAEHFANSDGAQSLEARYRHLDDRVGRLSQEVAGISATLGQVSHTLETISHRVNTPQRVEWAAIIAACAFVSSLGYAAITPVKERVQEHTDIISLVQTRQRDVAAALGQVDALKLTSASEHARTHDYLTTLEARDRETAKAVSATQARLDEIEDRLRDVDMAGSRKWIVPAH